MFEESKGISKQPNKQLSYSIFLYFICCLVVFFFIEKKGLSLKWVQEIS